MSHFVLLLDAALCVVLVVIAIEGLRQVHLRQHPWLTLAFAGLALASFGVLTLVLKVGCLPLWVLPLQALAMFYSTRLLTAAHVRLKGAQHVEGTPVGPAGPRQAHH